MKYLSFDIAEVDADIRCLEAMASTASAEHAAVMAEVGRVLDWAWQAYPHTHGRIDDGMDWDHDLAVVEEAGGWHTVCLTLTATRGFTDDLLLWMAADAC